jgi:hypothetical protein
MSAVERRAGTSRPPPRSAEVQGCGVIAQCRPEKVDADKAYDCRRCRGYLSRPGGSRWRIARCGIESSSQRLGCHRWKAERTIAWLAGCRRLRIRYDRDSERFFAFAMLAGDRLCYHRLPCAITARLP